MDRPHELIGDADDPADVAEPRDFGDDWVHELVAMTRPGVEINVPHRGLRDRIVPFEYDDFD